LRLTEQAQALIESKAPDQAIRILEKAIAIDPTNGYNYYFLAEAWLMKGDRKQALEFNQLAGIYLKKDAESILKVKRQKARIKE
jgi:predicted Zn-dependent protease